VFQRRSQKVRAGVLAAKMGNRRQHFLHVMSPGLVRHYGEIYIDVDPKKLVKTRMAKSVHDAGWSMLPQHAVVRVDWDWRRDAHSSERCSSQTCSVCGCIPASSPKGLGALGVRQWRCNECGTLHDRDINAARNIEIAGVERRFPVAEIPALQGREKRQTICSASRRLSMREARNRNARARAGSSAVRRNSS
jgi:putative transposase